ncbi:MAG: SIMPL domain-containing protein [Patescibacteria group bacterium]
METLYTNKRFIKAAIALIILLSLFVLALFVNEVKSGSYIGREGQPLPTITVSGTADVIAVSDLATLSVNLTKDGATAKEAQDLLNQSIAKTVDYLKGQNIEDKDIKSEYGGVNPKYSYDQMVCITYPCPQRDPKIVGYTATQTITVKVRAADMANEIRTGLTNLGNTNIYGPTFTIDDEDVFKAEAREKAITDAREKAEVLARQLDVRLGKIINFSEGNNGSYPMYEKAMVANQAMDASGAAPAPTLPKGENTITSNVTITYEIH